MNDAKSSFEIMEFKVLVQFLTRKHTTLAIICNIFELSSMSAFQRVVKRAVTHKIGSTVIKTVT
jgi:hypothetical protein